MSTPTRPDVPFEDVLAQEKARDPEFARWWDRTGPAREVAMALMTYRSRHDLTQGQLASLVGVKQPQIARWESGDALPSSANLARLSGKLGLEFIISYTPTDRKPKHLTKSTLQDAVTYEEHGATIRFATS